MNNLEKRIEKLEQSASVGKRNRPWLIVVTGELNRRATSEEIETHKKQADAKVKAAKAEYLAAHPEYSERDINVISVISEETKRLLERVMAGERRGKLLDASSNGEGTE